jgi:hypothetical protein
LIFNYSNQIILKRTIRLTESKLKNLIKNIAEQNFPNPDEKYGNSVGPGKTFVLGQIVPPVTMDGSLFSNGVDKIDVTSDAYVKGINAIRDAIKKGSTSITVEGGASAVGSKEGYDNNALAERRAKNFINSVRKEFPSINFKITTKVGKSTTKNSPEANREQYVKLTFPGRMSGGKIGPSVDNTQLKYKPLAPEKSDTKVIDGFKYVKKCYWMPIERAGDIGDDVTIFDILRKFKLSK